jgi:hypothetical protein
LKDGESPHPTNYRGCSYAKEELQRRKNQRISNQGSSGRTFSKYTTPEQSFASALRSSVESKQPSENQKESAGPQKKHVANKASGQSMQVEIVNSNAMDMFVAFTMVQQIMTGISSAASEEENVSIIIKSVFNLLKRNGGYSS